MSSNTIDPQLHIQALSEKIRLQTLQIEKLTKKVEKWKKNCEEAQKSADSSQSIVVTLQKMIHQSQNLYDKSRTENDRLEQENSKLQKQLRDKKSKIKQLELLNESKTQQIATLQTQNQLTNSNVTPTRLSMSSGASTPSTLSPSIIEDDKDKDSTLSSPASLQGTISQKRTTSKSNKAWKILGVTNEDEIVNEQPPEETRNRSNSTTSHESSSDSAEKPTSKTKKRRSVNLTGSQKLTKSPSVSLDNKLDYSGTFGRTRSHTIALTKSSSGVEAVITAFIESPDLKLQTALKSNWTIAEARQKLQKKFPGDTSNFYLFYKKGGKGSSKIRLMEEDKTVEYYKKKFSDSKIQVLFQDRNYIGRKNDGNNSTVMDILNEAITTHNTKLVPTALSELAQDSSQDINAKDSNGNTLLHRACIHCVANDNDEDILRSILLAKNIQLESFNNDGDSPLHIFCLKYGLPNSCVAIASLMLTRAPELISKQNKVGETPLHKAIQNPTVRLLLAPFLLQHGADTQLPGSNGETGTSSLYSAHRIALHYAVRSERKDLVRILLQYGCSPHTKNKNNDTAYDVAMKLGLKDIAKVVKCAQDLHDWLEKLKLGDHFLGFLRQELFLDILAFADDNTIGSIIASVHIPEAVQTKFRKACAQLKDKYTKREFLERMKKATKQKAMDQHLPMESTSDYSVSAFQGKNTQFGQTYSEYEVNDLKQSLMELYKKHKKSYKDLKSLQQNSNGKSIKSTASSNELVVSANSSSNNMSWLISHQVLEFTKELGRGNSAVVYKGFFEGKKVAIKVMTQSQKDKTLDEFKKEFAVMSVLHSPCIVHFYGACLEPRICIVMEYCHRGSLQTVLKNHTSSNPILPWHRLFKIAIETTAAVNILHSWNPALCHRDLKSLNVMVDKEWNVKLADFGLARFLIPENAKTMTKFCGTYVYAAPELYSGVSYNDKSDIYSLAIIFWELANTKDKGKYEIPFSEFTHLKIDYQIFFHASQKDLRPTLPKASEGPFNQLITQMWSPKPENRPSAQQIVEVLEKIKDQYKDDNQS